MVLEMYSVGVEEHGKKKRQVAPHPHTLERVNKHARTHWVWLLRHCKCGIGCGASERRGVKETLVISYHRTGIWMFSSEVPGSLALCSRLITEVVIFPFVVGPPEREVTTTPVMPRGRALPCTLEWISFPVVAGTGTGDR